ncbi:unnamed protein product [Polarella glacialis]|uniref:DUF711 family protein n=1 Tax=Polarella glacialis TaxID=89957 RepID=A0A813HV28_POLGL|nr:unnamed protein product [Polarella glacialis]
MYQCRRSNPCPRSWQRGRQSCRRSCLILAASPWLSCAFIFWCQCYPWRTHWPPRELAMAAPLLKVRTVTVGITLEREHPEKWPLLIERAAAFNAAATARLTAAGFEVQTTRVSTNSFESYLDATDSAALLEGFRRIDAELVRHGIGLFAAGPARTAEGVALAPDIIKLGPRISLSGVMPGPLDSKMASNLAAAVLRIAQETEGGEGNFQFCASFNVQPGIPFFPAAYHEGEPGFAIGCETSALLWDALPRAAGDLELAQQLLIKTFEEQMKPLEEIAIELSQIHEFPYNGIDASVAPLGSAPPLTDSFESLGLGRFGESGTLAVSALVTGALKQLKGLKICGYTGLMLPPLEDAGLARRAVEQGYRIHDLLMYSAVCGLGLDTVPIPGNVEQQKVAALLLDVAALAFRLNKPLTARLFPVPGKVAGEKTDFKNPFLCAHSPGLRSDLGIKAHRLCPKSEHEGSASLLRRPQRQGAVVWPLLQAATLQAPTAMVLKMTPGEDNQQSAAASAKEGCLLLLLLLWLWLLLLLLVVVP